MIFKPLNNEAEWRWAKEHIRMIVCEDSQGIVVWRDGEIQAMAVADSFTADSCNVHMAIVNPFVIRAGFLHEVARHLFVACGRSRIFGIVPSTNEKAIRLDKHIGFYEVTRVPDAMGEGVDYVILRMDKDNCRWLEPMKEAA